MTILPDIRKIAVLRANAFGDFIAALPALYALRETYPDAEIAYLGKPWHKELLEQRPSPVDRVIVVPYSHGVRVEPDMVVDEDALEAFFAAMAQEKFDLAIQMHGGGRYSNVFTNRLGARITCGMRTPDAAPLDLWMPYIYYQNEFIRLLELVSLVGARACEHEPRLAVVERDRREVRTALPRLSRPYVVLHPGAGDVRRRWPGERFAAVGDKLSEQGFQVVVTGTGAERPIVDSVVRGMRYPALDAFDRLSTGGMAGLFADAALAISNDSGPLHFAMAAGAPTIGLFWCGNFVNWAHLGRTRHRALVAWMVRCPLCGANMSREVPPDNPCDHLACFVDTITVEEVLSAADDLLGYQEVIRQQHTRFALSTTEGPSV